MDFETRCLVLVLATVTHATLTTSCHPQPNAFCSDCAAGGHGGAAAMSEQEGRPAPPNGGSPAEAAHPDQSGAAGNDGAAAGETASATPECTSDDDCADGKACNGLESCQDGHCEAGRAVSCPTISECFEAEAGAACRYSASERFVVYTGDELGDPWDNAIGLSITRLDQPVRVSFSEGVMDEEFSSISRYSWSPDGRRLLFSAQCLDSVNNVWDQKFFWFDVTEALNGQPRRIPNVRIDDNGTFNFLGWSPSSNTVVIGRDDERYAVRFTASGAETAQLPTTGSILLCGDDATAAYATEKDTRLATVGGPPSDETVLPAKLLSSSPDGRWLLLSDEQHAYLARCSSDSRLEALGGPAVVTSSWSPNSEYVVYSDTDPNTVPELTPKALSAFRVESSSAHVPVFEAIASDPHVSFEPESTRFLFVEQTPEDALVLQIVDLASPSSRVVLPMPTALASPSASNILMRTWWLGTTGLLSYETLVGDNPGRYSMAATQNAAPRLLARAGSFSDFWYSDDGTRAIWIESIGDSFDAVNEAYTLDLTRDDSRAHAIFAEPLLGSVRLADPRIIVRFSQDPSSSMDVFAVPSDYEGEPVPINAGRVTAGPALQPRP
jgi:hypothetical protein